MINKSESPNPFGMSAERQMWRAYSREYKMPVKLVKWLYSQWNPNEFQRFGDFVKDYISKL